jgi:hypothetical protein
MKQGVMYACTLCEIRVDFLKKAFPGFPKSLRHKGNHRNGMAETGRKNWTD